MDKLQKTFLFRFRIALLIWILLVNLFFHLIHFEYGWLIFISNIMMFTMEGELKDRFISVEIGGLVGLILTVLALLAIPALSKIIGDTMGFMIPLAIVLFILIVLHPYAPKVFNNAGFAYLTCACIDPEAFASHLFLFFVAFVMGSTLFNGGCMLIMHGLKKYTFRQVPA